jgi:3-oxoacyl-[acyl-carrier protein] reductase
MIDLGLTRRVVAITGCASPFGQAIAARFLAGGARVFGADLAVDGCSALRDQGAELASVDLRDPVATRQWSETIERTCAQAVGVLVHNAGGVCGQEPQSFEQVSDQDWNAILSANLDTARNAIAACLPAMKAARTGVVITIGSGAATRPSLTGVQAYCAAKHALLGLTRQLAHELGPWGIRVNSVSPGFVLTNAATQRQWAAMGRDGQKALMNAIPLRRLGTPADIANAVLLLASDLGAFITGENLAVNGGR